MKCLRILPEIWASTLRWPGRSTRNMVPGNTWVTVPSVTICPSFDMTRNIFVNVHLSRGARVRRHTLLATPVSILVQLIQRDGRQIFAEFLTFPPCARLAMFLQSGETVTVKTCSNVVRRLVWKRIVGQ